MPQQKEMGVLAQNSYSAGGGGGATGAGVGGETGGAGGGGDVGGAGRFGDNLLIGGFGGYGSPPDTGSISFPYRTRRTLPSSGNLRIGLSNSISAHVLFGGGRRIASRTIG